MSKKHLILAFVVLVGLSFIWSDSNRGEDYRVIQQAVKKEKSEPAPAINGIAWLRIEVVENGKDVVKIKLPLSIVETIAESCGDREFEAGKHCNVNLKKILADLKRMGPTALVEIEDKGDRVKIWIE